MLPMRQSLDGSPVRLQGPAAHNHPSRCMCLQDDQEQRVPELLRQLRHGGQEEQLQAALELERLAETDDQATRKAIVKAHGVGALVAALGSSAAEVQGAAAGEFRDLLGSACISIVRPGLDNSAQRAWRIRACRSKAANSCSM
jgi:hypothetical protein